MKKKDRYKYVLEYFQGRMPTVTTELEFGSVYQLLVAVMLSAQCTDKRVNMVTPGLFERYPDAKFMRRLSLRTFMNTSRAFHIPIQRRAI